MLRYLLYQDEKANLVASVFKEEIQCFFDQSFRNQEIHLSVKTFLLFLASSKPSFPQKYLPKIFEWVHKN